MSTLTIIVAVIVVLVVASVGFIYLQNNASTSTIQSTPTTTTTAGASQQYVTLGLSIPVSFPVGQDAQDAANMAVSEINAQGGVLMNNTHFQLKTVTEDTDEMDWTIPVDQGVAALQKLMTVDGADVVLGGVRTDVVVAQAAHLSQYQKVFVDVESNEPLVEAQVLQNYSAYKYYFHTFVNGSAIGPSLVKFPIALKNYAQNHAGFGNITNVAMLGENALWTVGPMGRPAGNSSFANGLRHSGFNIAYASLFPLNTQDFSAYLNQIAAAKVGLIILFFSGSDGVSFAQQWSNYNWPGGVRPVVFGPGLTGGFSQFWQQSNGAAQGMIPWPSTVNVSLTSKTVPFVDKFYSQYGHTPNTMAVDMYDSIYLVTQAMSNANTWQASKLIPAMENITYTGVMGTIHFTRSHGINLPQIPLYETFGQWQNGQLVPIWNSTSPAVSSKMIPP
ncbi:MAG TPA: ABC transporter substrate-binding protein [Nitrososphaerales archaeon]|nr:ABC transporter substrate-binding protein [Nitrososphaerales archaeon]